MFPQRYHTIIQFPEQQFIVDSENMQITNRPDVNEYIKEPVREGWSYGESL